MRMNEYVVSFSFPCVGARAALKKSRVRRSFCTSSGQGADVTAICGNLVRFSQECPDPGSKPGTFRALCDCEVTTESCFAPLMWETLLAMHKPDRDPFDWDPSDSPDPNQPDLSFNARGRAFFFVGLHPAASRLARRSPASCLVFNCHNQFERLRANGNTDGMQRLIRRHEMYLHGSINSVRTLFGNQSEARRYSGVAVPPNSRCPAHQIAEIHGA